METDTKCRKPRQLSRSLGAEAFELQDEIFGGMIDEEEAWGAGARLSGNSSVRRPQVFAEDFLACSEKTI